MSKRLILIERPQDVARPRGVSLSSETVWISLAPAASVALDQRGIAWRILEEFTPAEEFNRAALDRYRWLDGFTADLDDRIQTAIPLFNTLGTRPATSHYYALKILMDCVAAKAQLLRNALIALEPSEVLFMPTRPGRFGRNLYFEEESAFSHLIPPVARAAGIPAIPLGPPARFDERGSRWTACHAVLSAKKRSMEQRARSGLEASWRPASGRRPRVSGTPHPRVLVLSNRHDLPALLQALRGRYGIDVQEVPLERIPSVRPAASEARRIAGTVRPLAVKLWDSLRRDESWRASLSLPGLDLFPVLRTRLERFVCDGLPEIALALVVWMDELRRCRPSAVLSCSSNVGYLGQSVCAAARSAGIPIILYQEGGGFGVPCAPIYDHTDMRNCDVFLAYGHGTSVHLAARGVRPRGVVLKIGSARLDQLRASLNGHRVDAQSYLYLPTQLHGNAQHHPYNGGTATYYFERQKQLISILAGFPEIRVTVKLPPSERDRSLVHWLSQQRFRNCRVVEGAPLSSLLPKAGGFILDFPSTTLLEALVTERPIFICLDPYLTELNPEAEEVLARRAVICRGLEGFRAAFSRHLTGEAQSVDPSEPTARRWYATHLDNGGSLDRAARAVITACRAREGKGLHSFVSSQHRVLAGDRPRRPAETPAAQLVGLDDRSHASGCLGFGRTRTELDVVTLR